MIRVYLTVVQFAWEGWLASVRGDTVRVARLERAADAVGKRWAEKMGSKR